MPMRGRACFRVSGQGNIAAHPTPIPVRLRSISQHTIRLFAQRRVNQNVPAMINVLACVVGEKIRLEAEIRPSHVFFSDGAWVVEAVFTTAKIPALNEIVTKLSRAAQAAQQRGGVFRI